VSVSAWEALFFIVVLKIPVVYIGLVVWWAVRANPDRPEGGEEVAVATPRSPCDWDEWRRRRSRRARFSRPSNPSLRGARAATR
jgi:hypothetical protein